MVFENIDQELCGEPVAYAEEMTLRVLTRQQAWQENYLLRPDCNYLGLIIADGGETTPIMFTTLTSVKEFISEMHPRSVEILGSDNEAFALKTALTRDAGESLH